MKLTTKPYLLAWLIVIASLFLRAPPTSTAQQLVTSKTKATIKNSFFELEVIRLANLERTALGLKPLKLNNALTSAARNHNQDMIVNNFFDHIGSSDNTPQDRVCAAGYLPYQGNCYVAENIAAGQTSPEHVVASWMNSDGHRANILSTKLREIGVGYATGGKWGHYWTMSLGSQPNVFPIFINNGDNATLSRQVKITLTEETIADWMPFSPPKSIMVSEDPNFTNAQSQAWKTSLDFTLSDEANVKTVYVKLVDGENSAISSASIWLVDLNSFSNTVFIPFIGEGQSE